MLNQLDSEDFIYATPKGHLFSGHPTGKQVIEIMKKKTDKVLISFSGGKDALCAWLAIKDHFEVVPFYLYTIPNLGFVERTLKYYEEFFGVRIRRYPSPSLEQKLSNLVFMPPERCWKVEGVGFVSGDYDDIRKMAAEDAGMDPDETWYVSGVRASDSLNRRASFRIHGPFTHSKKVFYPVWDVRKSGLLKMLKLSGVKMPIDYWLFGKSFDGIDFRFLYPIKKYFPDDYAKIIDLFPLAELELKRYEFYGQK